MISPTSRYYAIETATRDVDGRTLVYLRRRFLPQPDRLVVIQEHVVALGDRLDNVTARYLDDPEQFWRVADANDAMNPVDLTAAPGRTLRVPVPQP